jgi:hypothetical protein
VQTRETRCERVILITTKDNSLLKTVFGLKLLHLGLKSANLRRFSAKSQEAVTVPRV